MDGSEPDCEVSEPTLGEIVFPKMQPARRDLQCWEASGGCVGPEVHAPDPLVEAAVAAALTATELGLGWQPTERLLRVSLAPVVSTERAASAIVAVMIAVESAAALDAAERAIRCALARTWLPAPGPCAQLHHVPQQCAQKCTVVEMVDVPVVPIQPVELQLSADHERTPECPVGVSEKCMPTPPRHNCPSTAVLLDGISPKQLFDDDADEALERAAPQVLTQERIVEVPLPQTDGNCLGVQTTLYHVSGSMWPRVQVMDVVSQVARVEAQEAAKQVAMPLAELPERDVVVSRMMQVEKPAEVPQMRTAVEAKQVPGDKDIFIEAVSEDEKGPVEVPQVHNVEAITQVPMASMQQVAKQVPKVQLQVKKCVVDVPTLPRVEQPVEVLEVLPVEVISLAPRVDVQMVDKTNPFVRTKEREQIVEVPQVMYEERLVEAPQVGKPSSPSWCHGRRYRKLQFRIRSPRSGPRKVSQR